MAGYTIHVREGLSPKEIGRAAELGPSEVLAEAPLTDLAQSAGFSVILNDDVTPDFGSTCEAIVRARIELEECLRSEEGDIVFEEEQAKKGSMLQGISEGLLQRSLLVLSRA